MKYHCRVLHCLLLCLVSVSNANVVHVGDIKLIPCQETGDSCQNPTQVIGTLMVYFDADEHAPDWHPVCSDGFRDEHWKSSTAICSILGYDKGQSLPYNPHTMDKMKFVMRNDFALTGLNCMESNGAPPTHLLRCDHTVYTTDKNCEQPIFLKCNKLSSSFPGRLFSKRTASVILETNWPGGGTRLLSCYLLRPGEPRGSPLVKDTYPGQVQLCPPDQIIDNSTYPAQQISFGIISVNLGSMWGSVNENSNTMIGSNQVNGVCQQLGFTGAVRNSARTVSSYSSYTFTHCLSPKNEENGLYGTWVTVDDTSRCNSSPCPCFSCCYKYERNGTLCPKSKQQGGLCPTGHCCAENDIVIECTFDKTANPPPPSGTSDTCSFLSGHNVLSTDACSQQQPGGYSEQSLLVGILVPSVLLVIVVVSGAVIVLIAVRRHKKLGGYQRIDGANGGGGGGAGGGGNGREEAN